MEQVSWTLFAQIIVLIILTLMLVQIVIEGIITKVGAIIGLIKTDGKGWE